MSTRPTSIRREASETAAFAPPYRHELADADHDELLGYLKTLKGGVLVSGYPHPLYDHALRGWTRTEARAMADGARSRIEVLWINEAAEAMRRGPLFATRRP